MDRKNGCIRFTIALLCMCCMGCSEQVLSPKEIGRFRPVPVVNIILDSLGVEDEPKETYSGAEDPRPEDVITYEQDYMFGVGDTIRINIYELLQQGVPFTNDYVVTETGRISIPDVGQIRAAGLTEVKLEEEIKDILSPNILLEPFVRVTLLGSQQRTVSISGNGVGRSTRLQLPRYDFRLIDLIASAGGVNEFNVSNIYVSREVTGAESTSNPTVESELLEPKSQDIEQPTEPEIDLRQVAPDNDKTNSNQQDKILEIIAPYAKGVTVDNEIIITSSEMVTDKELEALAAPKNLEPELSMDFDYAQTSEARAGIESSSIQQADSSRIEWVFEDGRWIPIRTGRAEDVKQTGDHKRNLEFTQERLPLEEPTEAGYGWEQVGTGGKQVRVIKIPVDKLLGGDPRYNIILRPGDSVSVPVDIIGEFYIMGNVNRSGPINLTGRPMTLKMAISAAGGLSQLAWPKKVEVIRRVGRNKEEIVLVDLDKIANGLQPDFFIKPNDLINVGTHPTSMIRAVVRTSYNLSLNYARNFATPTTTFTGDRFNDFDSAWEDFKDMF